jgi:ferric-dicitrate binding protein FerR (iron transport regulator)
MTMFTKHVIKQLSAYCNGELAADQSQRVREHLLACKRCRKEHDEIKLGVNLAQQLPLASAPAEMWSEIEALLDEPSRRPVFEPKAPRLAFAFSWYRVAAVSAVILVGVAIGLMVSWRSIYNVPRASWAVESVGAVRIDGNKISDKGRLAVGETLETGASSVAKVTVSEIGEVELDPNSRIRLVQTGLAEHRISLERGLIRATISAPPRLFFVDTPAAEAIDLGCVYTLQVDDAGRSLLHVTLGWVALVRNGREVYVPRFAMCQARPGIGPGTPYFEDASETFVRALDEFDFENGGERPFNTLLAEARPRDTFTLWHLLSRVEGDQRVQVLNRMIELVGLPNGITREGTLQLDQNMLDAWKDEMDTVWF